jgi:hypothetical protein
MAVVIFHQHFLPIARRLAPIFGLAVVLMIPPASGLGDPPETAGPPVSVTGRLEVVIGDDLERGRSDTLHFVRDEVTGRAYRLQFSGELPANARAGALVTVHGSIRGRELLLMADGAGDPDLRVVQTTTAEASIVSGQQNTLVMIAGFPDKPVACSAGDVAATMFTGPAGTTVDDLYQETSFTAVSFAGSVRGPYVLQSTASSACDPFAWADEADAQAAAEGVDLQSFARKVYVLPTGTGCGYAGLANVGGTSTRAWILHCGLPDLYAHELGHNLGMGHAANATADYGDVSDVMGLSGQKLRQINAPHRHQMGWTSTARIVDVAGSGVYNLSSLQVSASQAPYPQILRISKPDTEQYYYLSYRDAIGFDTNLGWSYRNKLSVHRYDGSGPAKTYLLASLDDGQSYVDDVNGISFRRVAQGSGYLTAEVAFDGGSCSPQSPAVAISPASQSGVAGVTLNYTVTVTNRDGSSCGSHTFDLSSTLPTGWTGWLSPPSLSLASGGSGTAVLSVASSTSAPSGTQQLRVDARDRLDGSHAGSATATYVVESACIAAAPSVSISPSRQTGKPGSQLSYSVSIRNNDSAACQATTFSLSAQRPSGWAGSISPGSVTLGPGGTAAATLTVTSASGATDGDYAVGVQGTDAADSSHSSGGSAVYAVAAEASPPASDSEPPTIPAGLTASVKRKQVNLSWQPASDNVGVAGYRVRRDGAVVATVSNPSHVDRGGVAGSVYSVSAFDAAGNESGLSASATAVSGNGNGGSGNGKKPR